MDAILKGPILSAASKDSDTPDYVGFICAGLAVLFFGSNFVPIKRCPTGDGIFFQWIFCWVIWMCGLAVYFYKDRPDFYPLVMVGGGLWCLGNASTVLILKTIGLAQGLLIWGTSCLVFGWAFSRFGLFSIEKAAIQHSAMNYCGVTLCTLAGFCYFFIKTNNGETETIDQQDDENLLSESVEDVIQIVPDIEDSSFLTNLSPRKKAILGKSLAAFTGFCFSVCFVPILYIQNHPEKYPNASKDMLDHLFAHWTGIFVTSSIIFLIYSVYMRNRPHIYNTLILPTVGSAIAWSIAGVSWFIATKVLSQAVSFPIINSGPGAIGALWGIFLFKEIKGLRNYLILTVGFAITIGGCILTAASIE